MQLWEIELGFREIKLGLLQQGAVQRCKKPELVRQEWRDSLIAFDLISEEMPQMAVDMKVLPQRLSFAWFTIATPPPVSG